jgi:hypothetical protein
MPIKDHERKLAVMKAWRSKRTPAYNRWLYARRKLVYDQRDSLRAAVGMALAALRADSESGAEMILADALKEIDLLAIGVGNRFDHERDEPYWDDTR